MRPIGLRSARAAAKRRRAHPKKVGTLPVGGGGEVKQTNQIGAFIPLVDAIEIANNTLTADALLTQRKWADYLVNQRQAHYLFTVKGNQPKLLAALQTAFAKQLTDAQRLRAILTRAFAKFMGITHPPPAGLIAQPHPL